MAKIYGRAIAVGGGAVPDIFGDGSDGDLVVQSGQTVILEVTVPHQSVVEKQYNSILIEAGGTLKCSDPNAGLVLRCKNDCTIQGTITQAMMAPKTNPNTGYVYPAELICGDGGKGGKGSDRNYTSSGDWVHRVGGSGGAGMPARPYGGGYSGGGGGEAASANGGAGGSVNLLTVSVPTSSMFVGGTNGGPGQYGGGGAGGAGEPGNGGNGPGDNGDNAAGAWKGAGGGAGNIGGGVLLLYVGGTLSLEGTIDCSGGNGGNGGESEWSSAQDAGGAGGAGGGAIYIVHNEPTITNTASLLVNGGTAGTGYNSAVDSMVAGGIGSITIKQYEEGMVA